MNFLISFHYSSVPPVKIITGIKNYRGFLFSLMEDATVIKNYTELHEFIDDYKSNIPLLLKQQKILKIVL